MHIYPSYQCNPIHKNWILMFQFHYYNSLISFRYFVLFINTCILVSFYWCLLLLLVLTLVWYHNVYCWFTEKILTRYYQNWFPFPFMWQISLKTHLEWCCYCTFLDYWFILILYFILFSTKEISFWFLQDIFLFEILCHIYIYYILIHN